MAYEQAASRLTPLGVLALLWGSGRGAPARYYIPPELGPTCCSTR